MESPFTDYSGGGYHHEHQVHDDILFETPFADWPVQQHMTYAGTEPENLLLQEVHQTGDATLTVADPGTAASDEYREPTLSGNPLLVVSPSDRKLKLSENFTVGEFAQAQSEKYKFNFTRIDPDLLRNLQKLRTFIGKPVAIVDGYYTPAYLSKVLGITDPAKISLNPHIHGRGVKLTVKGYDNMFKQIAIAAHVVCDRGIHVGIGQSSMTLYVKQPITPTPDLMEEDYQRIVSYIADERIKVATQTFTVDVKRLIIDHKEVYRQEMERAVGAFTAILLKVFYKQENIPAEWMNWEIPLGNVISLMYNNSKTKHPDVILYALAYSAFGNLYRNYLKSANVGDVVDYLVNELTSLKDIKDRFTKGSFLANRNETDKTRFIDNCRQRIIIGRADKSSYNVSVPIFFDWLHHPQDKIFKEKLSEFIRNVFFQNHYAYDIPAQQTPVGGSHPNVKESVPEPDKPVIDYTGRYYAPFDPGHETLFGRYLLINQAGNYISGKLGGIYKKPVKNLRNTITEFYGKVDDKGVAICAVFPQQTLMLKKFGNVIRMALKDNARQEFILNVPLILRSKIPVMSNMIMNSFTRISDRNQDLMIILAWIQPPPDQLKVFLDSFRTSELEVKSAITEYYEVDETRPSLKQSGLRKFMSRLNLAVINYLKLPPMFKAFSNYYTRFVYGASEHWSPRSDKETRSLLNWIRKMLEDYRDFIGQGKLEDKYKGLYEFFGVSEDIPDIQYRYHIRIKLSSFGIGPVARSSGKITITNKTDFSKFPAAERWNTAEYPIVVWNATLSINPLKWTPKIASGQTIEAAVITNAAYSATDFSGADIQITEGKVFELPLSKSSGNVKVSTKVGIGGVVVLIDGRGKRTLELTADLDLSLPDTIEIEPSLSAAKEGTYEKIAGLLPSLTMYKGQIESEKTNADISSVPLPDKFAGNYQIKDTRYFLHDDAELTAQAIEAVGRLCAEELLAFSDDNSKIEIYGHTDASGKPDYNLKLSKYRALNVLQAIKDRLGDKLKAKIDKVDGMGESEANNIYGEHTQKNAWLRRVVVLINGRAVLSLGEI